MFVVINIDPGTTLNELMAFMTQRTITFSVTDQLGRLCDKSVPGDRREIGTQTEDSEEPSSKKSRHQNHYNGEDCGSPCSSATPSEPTDLGGLGGLAKRLKTERGGGGCEQTDQCDLTESAVLRNLIMEKLPMVPKREEPEEASVEDEMSNEYMANQISNQFLQAFFAEKQNAPLNGFGTIEENDSLEGESAMTSDLPTTFPLDGSPVSAIRYKPAYASTKRGVCHVCNREVSLITTHRRRHAITHLGFKTLKCGLCHKFFSRQDLATGHFKKDHPNEEFFPFVDTMSDADEQQLITMLGMCFPEENLVRKRTKDVDVSKKIGKD